MNRGDANRAMAGAEYWSEKYLLWKAGLPTPFTFVVTLAEYLIAAYIGYRLA